MIKSTILLAVSLLGFIAAPLSVPQKGVINAEPTRPAVVRNEVPAPSLVTLTVNEVVVSVPARKALKTAPAKEKQLTCGRWEESQVGGSYRRCEWK